MIADLQTWLFAHLSGDAALRTDLGDPARIYDTVPAGRQLPCIVLRRVEATEWSTADLPGRALMATIDIWSRSENRAELYRIADRVTAVLRNADPVAGATRIVLTVPLTQSFTRERDQDAFFGQLRFRFLCEPRAD